LTQSLGVIDLELGAVLPSKLFSHARSAAVIDRRINVVVESPLRLGCPDVLHQFRQLRVEMSRRSLGRRLATHFFQALPCLGEASVDSPERGKIRAGTDSVRNSGGLRPQRHTQELGAPGPNQDIAEGAG